MKILLFIVILLYGLNAYPAEKNIRGFVREKEAPDQPIVGANIYWAATNHGTTSDENGAFNIALHQQGHPLVISFVGYQPDTLLINGDEPVWVYLEKNLELGEVVVKERPKGQYISSLSSIQSTKITATELQKAACCNLSESFETNASVDVSFSDAITGAKQIQMLGLSGIYVQTISENMPSMRGLAAPYGLGYVPGPWMESIQISKGTASVMNGYEAISGQINVEYKKPNSTEVLHLNLYGNDALKSEANFNYTYKLNDSLATTFLVHAEHHSKDLDDNTDGFLDMPHVKQINFMNRWFQTTKDGGDRQFGIKILDESRQAGQLGASTDVSGNLYGIEMRTQRYEFFAKNGILLPKVGTSIGMQLSGSYHNMDASYGLKQYTGSQYNAYFNLIYQGNFGSDLHTYKTGVSFQGDAFSETLNQRNMEQNEWVPGAWLEYNYHLKNKLNVLVGLRGDYSSLHGFFVTPRVHAKWNILEHLVLRGSAGKGYRTAIPLAENSYLLASSRQMLIDNNLKQEEALNLGTSLLYEFKLAGRDFTLMLDYYRTQFMNQIVRNVDSDVHAVHFTNLNGPSYSNALQAELFYELFRGFTVNAAYRINDVKQSINGTLREMPLTSRYKGMVSMSYATRMNKWQFDFTSQFNGGGRLPDPSVNNPLWEKEFDPYTVINAQITKNYKRWSFYLGSENLNNFKMHNPIIAASNPWGPDFDGSMIWGPVHGRKVYAGLRYTIHNY